MGWEWDEAQSARRAYLAACGERLPGLLDQVRAAGGDELEAEAICVEAVVEAWRRGVEAPERGGLTWSLSQAARHQLARVARRGLPLDVELATPSARDAEARAASLADRILSQAEARIQGLPPRSPSRLLRLQSALLPPGRSALRPASLGIATGLALLLAVGAEAVMAGPLHRPAPVSAGHSGRTSRHLHGVMPPFVNDGMIMPGGQARGMASPEPPTTDLANLHMVDQLHGWAILSERGPSKSSFWQTVGITDDGGRTWQARSPAPTYENMEPFFLDRDHAWVAGGSWSQTCPGAPSVIWRTEDRGRTWTRPTLLVPPGTIGMAPVSDFGFSDARHGWFLTSETCSGDTDPGGMALPSYHLYLSDDGGMSIHAANLPAMPERPDRVQVAFTTPRQGVLAVSGHSAAAIYLTRDGARTWSRALLPKLPPRVGQRTPGLDPQAVPGYRFDRPAFASPSAGAVVLGVGGLPPGALAGGPVVNVLLVTADGGASWVERALPGRVVANDLHLGPDLWVGGYDPAGGGFSGVWRSADWGRSWTKGFRIATLGDGELDFVSPRAGWWLDWRSGYIPPGASQDWLRHTTDGGLGFEVIPYAMPVTIYWTADSVPTFVSPRHP